MLKNYINMVNIHNFLLYQRFDILYLKKIKLISLLVFTSLIFISTANAKYASFVINENTYILPDEVINVRKLFRRTVGSRTEGGEGGTLFEPFNLAYTNTYLLRAGATGGLATYFAFASYQELVGKLFGSFIQFHWDVATKKLTITQRPRADNETILMHTDNYRPDITLFKDIYSKPWIRDYTLAVAKTMLGEARGKFSTIAGPQGGTTLNGEALKAEGLAMMEKLDAEINEFADGGTPHSFVIG